MKITISQEGIKPISIIVSDSINDKSGSKSQEGVISFFKYSNSFFKLHNERIYKLGISLKLWVDKIRGEYDHRYITAVNEDWRSFSKTIKKDKSITVEGYIQYLIDTKYNKSYIEKQKKDKLRQENALPSDIEKILHSRIETLANKTLDVSKTIISSIRSNIKIKEYFDGVKNDYKKYSSFNYLKYIEKIPSKEEIINQINRGVKLDLHNKKNVNNIKLDCIIYIVDMESLREDIGDDMYDDIGDGIYDIFEENIPNIDASPYDFDIGGLDWSSISATISEK